MDDDWDVCPYCNTHVNLPAPTDLNTGYLPRWLRSDKLSGPVVIEWLIEHDDHYRVHLYKWNEVSANSAQAIILATVAADIAAFYGSGKPWTTIVQLLDEMSKPEELRRLITVWQFGEDSIEARNYLLWWMEQNWGLSFGPALVEQSFTKKSTTR